MNKKTLEKANEMNMSEGTEKVTANNEEAVQPTVTVSASDDAAMYQQTFTISKHLTSKEAVQLLSDFERYRKNPANLMEVHLISESGEDLSNNWEGKGFRNMKSSIRGYSYSDCMGLIWEIKEYSEVCRDFEYKSYFIDIILEPAMFINDRVDTLIYDENLLKPIIDYLLDESKAISPFFDDFSSYFLKQINYRIDITTDKPQILAKLQNRFNLPVIYREWESFPSDSSENPRTKSSNHMDSRAVKICSASYYINNRAICYEINRKFSRDYSLKELMEKDSAATKLIIEQMLSEDYLGRTAVAYLKTAVMGGSYYSISKAADIMNSSSIPIDKQNSLMETLLFIEQHKGIYNAKMVYKDTKEPLYDFINNLHELAELGINPVTIPQEYNIDELSNPILKLNVQYDSDVDKKEVASHIEVEEVIGSLNIPCKIHREK